MSARDPRTGGFIGAEDEPEMRTVLTGHFKGLAARIIPGRNITSERWRDSVLVGIRDRYGRKFFRRMERANLKIKE